MNYLYNILDINKKKNIINIVTILIHIILTRIAITFTLFFFQISKHNYSI